VGAPDAQVNLLTRSGLPRLQGPSRPLPSPVIRWLTQDSAPTNQAPTGFFLDQMLFSATVSVVSKRGLLIEK
jgi:hypothetical protein